MIKLVKKKLTLTIEKKILEKAKEKARSSGLSLSKIVENALSYYIDPTVYCFKCGYKFKVSESEICPRCGWYKCPKCGACACQLGEEGAKVAFYMRKTLVDIFSSTDV